MEKGDTRGQMKLGNLISKLLNAGRIDDVRAAAEDPAARERMMKEFGITEA